MRTFRSSRPIAPRSVRGLALALAAAAGLAAGAARAQAQAPLTGGMAGAASPAPTAPAPTRDAETAMPARPVVRQTQAPLPAPQPAPGAPREEQFGDVTRGLLAAQADGRRAGAALPVLGAVSTAAWDRYLASFTHPVPEWFQKRVDTRNTN